MVSEKLLKSNRGWVYRNNDVIAKEVSQIELQLFSVRAVGGDIEFNEVKTHAVLDLLDRFNDASTFNHAVYLTQSHKKLTGDAFWYVEGDRANVNNLFIIQPDKMEIKLGDFSDSTARLIEGYIYKDTVDGKMVEKEYDPDEIIHFKSPNPENPYRGLGAVEAIANDIDLDNLGLEVRRKFYENGGMFNFILTTDYKLNDDQIKRLGAKVRAAWTGIRNAFRIPILGSGLNVQNVQPSSKDNQEIQMMEWLRDKIMVGFGNTKASLGIIDDVNRASHDSSIAAWKQTTIRSEDLEFVDTLNERLLPRFGLNLVLGFKDPVPENRTEKIDEAVKLRQEDIINQNEARELLDFEPVQGGDEFSRDRAPQVVEVPEPLKHINLSKFLRRSGIYAKAQWQKDFKEKAKPLAKKILKARKAKNNVEVTQEHNQFTNDMVWEYWSKQIRLVEVIEERFENSVSQFIDEVRQEAIANLEEEVPVKSVKQLFDKKDLIAKAEIDFTPILMEEVIIAGQQAYKLIGLDEPYMPTDIRKLIARNVRKFAGSMLDTEKEKLTEIISNGIKEGLSVPQIKTNINEAFEKLNKVQAERITRTEVIKASNMAAVDAWEQSGVVEAKQWLTAEDDRVDPSCAFMNGKIIGLSDNYIDKGGELLGTKYEYDNIPEPPLHPNCRCVVLPVLIGEKGFVEQKFKTDKEQEEYIAKLEQLVGVNDD